MEFSIILVEPKYAGNAGAVARIMKNFGFNNLWFISPKFSIDDKECIKYSMHAYDIIKNAKILSSFDDVVKKVDYVVGTSSKVSDKDNQHVRKYFYIKEFADEIRKMEGKIGIAFGREDYGLVNEELKKCDLLVKIPTSFDYPSMNLSHAVAILLYEIYHAIQQPKHGKIIYADGKEKEMLHKFFDEFLNKINYPEYKKESTKILFRRIIGRAMLSKWEFHTLMGVFKKAIKK